VERRQLGDEGAERLAAIEVLRELPTGRRRELARLADELSASAGETLMAEGEPGYEFMMLEQGQADVVQGGQKINTMRPGDSFGELAVLSDGELRTASVVATTDVRAIVLTARFMREVHNRMGSVGERIDDDAIERRERDARRRGAGEGASGEHSAA